MIFSTFLAEMESTFPDNIRRPEEMFRYIDNNGPQFIYHGDNDYFVALLCDENGNVTEVLVAITYDDDYNYFPDMFEALLFIEGRENKESNLPGKK